VAGYLSSALLLGRGTWGRVRVTGASPEIWRELLRYGLPLTATFALEFVVSSSDRFLLGALASVDEVGRYAVSYDLGFQSVIALLMIVNLAAFPLSVRAVEARGRAGAETELRQHGTTLLLVALPAVVGLGVLAPNVAEVMIGREFRATAVSALPIIAAAALLSGLKAFYFDLSYQLGRVTGVQVWISAAAALLNVALNIWLIPRYGATGAAMATVAAYATGCGLSWAFGALGVRLPLPLGDWARVALAAGLMGFALWPLAHFRGAPALVLQCVVGAVSYGALALALDLSGARLLAGRVRQRLPWF
jgi:O-antigen/teichoic acid export membrane protein